MALGIKPLIEEKHWEFLGDRAYCRKMIIEVDEAIPFRGWAESVWEICKAHGKEVDMAEIREVRQLRKHDRFIAYCINAYGKLLIGKK